MEPLTIVLLQIRTVYQATYTASRLLVPVVQAGGHHRHFCHVLEHPARPAGIKVPGYTCIPEGVYEVTINHSSRFDRPMMLLSNQGDLSVEKAGVRFSGIRPHGGNTAADSDGCPLLAYHSNGAGKIWGRADQDLQLRVQRWLNKGHRVVWVVAS